MVNERFRMAERLVRAPMPDDFVVCILQTRGELVLAIRLDELKKGVHTDSAWELVHRNVAHWSNEDEFAAALIPEDLAADQKCSHNGQ